MGRTYSKLESLVLALEPRVVAVIGDVMLDRYVRGKVGRLSPEAPIQVLEVDDESVIPGGAANVAMKVLDLGSTVKLVGLVGDDVEGQDLRYHLAGRPGLVDSLTIDGARPTTVKTRYVAHNQQLLRVDREHRFAPSIVTRTRLAEAAFAAVLSADAVILEDYGKGVLGPEVIRAALEAARIQHIPVVVDPNGRDYRRYAGCTVLTPNLREAEVAAERPITDEASLIEAAESLVDQTGAALAVTREAEGISLFRREGDSGPVDHRHVPTVPVEVFDVTGAGDSVCATLAIALACRIEMADACALANLAGRAVVRQVGVGTISIGRLFHEAAEPERRHEKRVEIAEAVERVREVQEGGGKVVFTNGCFDILHFGHAHLLQFARAQGDFLVLGLNTDASVRRYKGPERPIVDEDQRAYMLSLYPFVDLIVLFDDDTPMALIEAIGPDILVKGGDYTPDTVVGRDFVEARGGQVVICPRLDGLSTSDLVRKIRENAA